jgi:hypothetical protein
VADGAGDGENCGRRLQPVLGPHTRHSVELAEIVGDRNQSFAAGVAADLHIMNAARRSRPCQFGPKLAIMGGRLLPKRQYLQSRLEVFDGCQVLGTAADFSEP